jgi:hypothetical protein
MSVITAVACVPSRVRALVEIAANEPSLSRRELQQRMVPLPQQLGDFRNLLSETVKLNLLVEDKETRTYSASIKLTDDVLGDETAFRNLCLDELISGPLNQKDHNAAVLRALSWFLTRKLGTHTGWSDEFKTLVSKDLDGEDFFELSSTAISQMLGYWAQYLGFAEWYAAKKIRYINPDPTRVLSNFIPIILEKEKNLSITTLFNELGTRIPIFELGSIRNKIEDRLKIKREKQSISYSTSFALMRLQQRKLIKLEHKSDSETWLLTGINGKTTRISHIMLNQKAVK